MIKALLATTIALSLMSSPLWAGPKEKKGPDCEKEAQKIRKKAEECLKIKNPEKRKACMDKVGEAAERAPQECRPMIDPIKSEIMEKERQMYPQQPPMGDENHRPGQDPQAHEGQGRDDMRGGDRGEHRPEMGGMDHRPMDQHPGNPPKNGEMRPPQDRRGEGKPGVDCGKVVNEIRKEADGCLKIKSHDKRQACMDKVGEHVEHAPPECKPALDPVKMETMGKEKQMYPDQEPTIR